MPKRKSAPVLDKSRLISSLLSDVSPITEVLGEPRKEEEVFSFPVQNLPFQRLTAGYDLKKYFLGKMYHLTLEGSFSALTPISCHGALDLRFSGLIKKGAPFFVGKGVPQGRETESDFPRLLNSDRPLLEECLGLEVEFLKVLFDPWDGWGRIRVRPYGGTLIHMYLPPLYYHVKLIKEQVLLSLSVMRRIGNLFYGWQSRPGPAVPGP